MSDIAIRVENLSKKYQIGETLKRHDTLRDAVVDALRAPFARRPGNQAGDDAQTLWALKDVSFEVKRGEVVGIIGRNGAGKSTLLKVLTRITEPSSGRAVLKGRVASLLEVGTGFHPELTGRENIYLNGAILGMRREEIARKFDEIVAFAEIERFLDTPVKRYSSGMYVRLAFAVAAHLEPEILLVDEVLAVGDAGFQKKCLGKMGSVAQEGRTVLFVSHNMVAIEGLCNSAMVLNNGFNVFAGKTNKAIEFYYNRSEYSQPVVDLTAYRGTFIEHQPILRELQLYDTNNMPTPMFNIGDEIKLRIKIKSEKVIGEPHLGIGITNANGLRVSTVHTRLQKIQFPPLSGDAFFDCLLRNTRLAPGKYFLKIVIGDPQTDFDVVENVPGFEVLPSDYLNSGKLPDEMQGVLIQDADWLCNY